MANYVNNPPYNANYGNYGGNVNVSPTGSSQANYNQQMNYQNFNNQASTQQPLVQRPAIPGRLVNSINDVIPGEIPMDGNISYFPTADGEIIHGLRWTREGNLDQVDYIRRRPEKIQEETTISNEQFETILTRLNEMQKEIKRISRPRKRNHQNQEGAEHE